MPRFIDIFDTLTLEQSNRFLIHIKHSKVSSKDKCTLFLEQLIKTVSIKNKAVKKQVDPDKLLILAKEFDKKNPNKFLTTCCSYLYKEIPAFLCVEHLQSKIKALEKPIIGELLFLEMLQFFEGKNYYKIQYKSLEKLLKKLPLSERSYEMELKISKQNLEYLYKNSNKKNSIDLNTHLFLVGRNQALSMLKADCTYLNLCLSGRIRKVDWNQIIHSNTVVKRYEQDTLVAIYSAIFNSFSLTFKKKIDEDNYSQIHKTYEVIINHYEDIDTNERGSIITFFKNILLELTWGNGSRELIHTLNIYLEKNNHILVNKVMSIRNYLNTINEAAKAKDFEWAENFMNKYKDKLPKDQESTYKAGQGLIYFEKQAYTETINIFDVEDRDFFNDPELENIRKVLVAKAYYEYFISKVKLNKTKKDPFGTILIKLQKFQEKTRKKKNLMKSKKNKNDIFLRQLIKLIPIAKSHYLRYDHKNEKMNKIKNWISATEKKKEEINNYDWLMAKAHDLKSDIIDYK